jgi:Undecaprenyl-phosphate glucose phosphotransferase
MTDIERYASNVSEGEAIPAEDAIGHSRRWRWSLDLLVCAVIVSDTFLIVVSAALGAYLFDPASIGAERLNEYFQLGFLAAFIFIGLFFLRGGYGAEKLVNVKSQAAYAVQTWIAVFFIVGWAAFLMKTTATFSRAAVTAHFLLGSVMLAAAHAWGTAWFRHQLVRRRISLRRVYVVGTWDNEQRSRIVDRFAAQGVEVVGISAIPSSKLGRSAFGSFCVQATAGVKAALASHPIDAVCIYLPWGDKRQIDEVRAALSPLPVPMVLLADSDAERNLNRPRHRFGEMVGFEIQRAPLSRADRFLKRALDVLVASMALVLLSPILFMTAAAIASRRDGPVLFKQHRKGFGGRPFSILKFRTMSVQENGAEVKQAEKGDSRVTPLGAVLRKTSIDELPQLINVLKGDMSIVGPRPHAIAHDNLYDRIIARYAFRHHVKPGITGWAQVNGCRGETREVHQMEERIEHDIWYINNWSILLDLRIVFRTAAQILSDRQAY